LGFIGKIVIHISNECTGERLPYRSALVLVAALLATRDVLSATLVILAIDISPVVPVAQSFLLWRRCDLAHGFAWAT
jgi:hypothetical protein